MGSLRCPDVVGRDEELAVLRRAVGRAASGAGGVVFVLGEAGIGKTRLVAEAEAAAHGLGMRVLRGRAVEARSRIPFRPISEAFQTALRSANGPSGDAIPDELHAFGPVLATVVPQWAADQAAVTPSLILLTEGIVRLLEVLGRDGGALVVLEDLHWADEDTLAAVDYLVDHLPSTPVLCIVTSRTDEPGTAARAIAGRAHRHSETVTLRRFDGAAVTDMAARCLGRPPDGAVVEGLAARSEGVPLLVEELLADYVEGRGTGQGPPLPPTYAAVLDRRLGYLADADRSVVEAAAALDPDADVSVLMAVTGLSRPVVIAALRAGVGANLLVEEVANGGPRLAFRHALIRDAVLAGLLPIQRRDLFAATAEAVERAFPGLPGEWCERVADLRWRAGDTLRAFTLLVEAGRRALKLGALLTAEQTLERARGLAAGDRWRTAGVDRVLVRVLALLGNAERMRELAASALRFMEGQPDLLGTPARVADLYLQLARGLAASGDWVGVDDPLRVAADLAAQGDDEQLRARVLALKARAAAEVDDADAADAAATAATEQGAALGLADVLCESFRARARLRLRRDDVDGAVRLLREAALVAETADRALDRIEVMLDLARVDLATTAAVDHVEAAFQLARAVEAPLVQVRVDLQLARAAVARFKIPEAQHAIGRAVEACRRYRFPLLAHALSVQAEVAAMQGDARAAAACAREVAATPAAPPSALAAAGCAMAAAAVVHDDTAAAIARLTDVDATLLDRWEPCGWYAGLLALLRTVEDARTGEHGRPAATASLAERLRALAWELSAGGGGHDAAVAAFRETDAALAPFVWRRHVVRRLVAEAALARGFREPVASLEEAATFFSTVGHARLGAACRGLQRRAGVTVPRAGRGSSAVPPTLAGAGVTSREMDVLNLVGSGLSNRQIAERLYLSVRTVESHVASVMRKTGVHTRAALVAVLLDADPVAR